MSKFFYNYNIKIISTEFIIRSSSTELSSSSETDNIIQETEVIFKKILTVGLPEVSKVIDSAISKRQGDQRKQFSWEKKYSIKGEMDSLWTPRDITSIDWSCYEAIVSSISQNIFSHLKMFSMQFRKNITVQDNKKRMSIANFKKICTNTYTYIICDENGSK